MFPRQPAKLLRLLVSEADRYEGKPLYEAVAEKCMELGIAGVTVLRGREGYGDSAEVHRGRVLSHDAPIVVTVVESAENVARLMPEIERMIDTGVIAVSDVEAIRIQKSELAS